MLWGRGSPGMGLNGPSTTAGRLSIVCCGGSGGSGGSGWHPAGCEWNLHDLLSILDSLMVFLMRARMCFDQSDTSLTCVVSALTVETPAFSKFELQQLHNLPLRAYPCSRTISPKRLAGLVAQHQINTTSNPILGKTKSRSEISVFGNH